VAQAKVDMITEQKNEKSQYLDQLSVQEIVGLMNEEDQLVALSVRAALPQITAAIEAIVEVMRGGGKLYYIGAGTSGRLGILDASECPPTFGVDPGLVNGIIAGGETAIRKAVENAEDDIEAGARDILSAIRPIDAVVGITASGTTPYVIGALRQANRLGVPTVSISCNRGAPLSLEAKFPIEIPAGPEIITGSTRLKAGTAQKMVLNMITTTVMIQMGKVYGNLMVNVQASNHKLRERVVRIIQDATDVNEETANLTCVQAGGNAPTAILMLKFGISRQEAAEALEQTNGHFGNTMKLLSKSL
jgi:N-acetylmuramic acid 6-phosphate etherase